MFLGFTKEEWKEVLVEWATKQLPFTVLGAVIAAVTVFTVMRATGC